MYRNRPKKKCVCYCPYCHQFGAAASGVAAEGRRKGGTPIMLCTACAPPKLEKKTKYLPGQGTLYPLS